MKIINIFRVVGKLVRASLLCIVIDPIIGQAMSKIRIIRISFTILIRIPRLE